MKVDGYRVDDLLGDSLVTRQRYVIPLWVSLLGAALRGVGRGLLWLVRHSVLTGSTVVLGWLYLRYGWVGVVVLVVTVAVLLATWCVLHPVSFGRFVVRPGLGQWRLLVRYRRRWRQAMIGGRLAVTHGKAEFLPVISRARSTRWADTLTVKLLHGQTPEQFAAAAEALRHVFGAYRCAAREACPGVVTLTFYRRDPLTEPIPALPVPQVGDDSDLTALWLGRTEDAVQWLLRLIGNHVLVVGASGAGKGSVLWSIIRALAPGVFLGSVELWVLDPKGGMEMTFGRRLFARFEDTNFEAMATLLEQAVKEMTARTSRLKGITRLHVPTPGDPLVVIIVDEIAALTAYCPDKKIKDRIKAALALLLSQGRAVGYLVIAAVQDPRKETIPLRDLFTIRIGLRMTEAEQVDLVLGDGAHDRGAHCERIPKSLPGVGYVLLDGDVDPIRIRAAYPTDNDIADACDLYEPVYSRPLAA